MEQTLRLYNSSALSDPAGPLFLTYSRLSLLEKRAGNLAASQVNLIKANYWNLCSLEREGLPEEKALEGMKRCTESQMEAFVNKLDRESNSGNLPLYAEELLRH